MAEMVIGVLSQKGGVGKSTLARLIATAYAQHDMRVAIADFNIKQKTSIDWAEVRAERGIGPRVDAFEGTQANRLKTNTSYDLIVADGSPDSQAITMSIAQIADLIVIPTSVSFDDLKPQLLFAREIAKKGVRAEQILFVVNRHTDNKALIQDAYDFLGDEFRVAQHSVPYRDSFIRCQNSGYSIGEVRKAIMGNVGALAETTENLAVEIATIAQEATA